MTITCDPVPPSTTTDDGFSCIIPDYSDVLASSSYVMEISVPTTSTTTGDFLFSKNITIGDTLIITLLFGIFLLISFKLLIQLFTRTKVIVTDINRKTIK